MADMTDEKTSSDESASSDDKYLFWTCGLMAVIIVSLVALWVIQRRHTQRVAQRLAEVRADHDRLKQSLLATQLPPGSIPPPKPVGIDQSVILNGEEVTARLVALEVGISLGLGRGDVLIVTGYTTHDPTPNPAHISGRPMPSTE